MGGSKALAPDHVLPTKGTASIDDTVEANGYSSSLASGENNYSGCWTTTAAITHMHVRVTSTATTSTSAGDDSDGKCSSATTTFIWYGPSTAATSNYSSTATTSPSNQ